MSFILIGISIFIILLIIIFLGIYNALIAMKENIKKAWANIDVILKQRYDEIPQLIEICNQYVQYEKSTFDKIMQARETMVNGKNKAAQIDATNDVTAELRGLLAVGESYPDLKSNNNFIQIQTRLSELEETLADRRELYNSTVNLYNIKIQQIPDVFFARFLNYSEESLFKITAQEKSKPSLKIGI